MLGGETAALINPLGLRERTAFSDRFHASSWRSYFIADRHLDDIAPSRPNAITGTDGFFTQFGYQGLKRGTAIGAHVFQLAQPVGYILQQLAVSHLMDLHMRD